MPSQDGDPIEALCTREVMGEAIGMLIARHDVDGAGPSAVAPLSLTGAVRYAFAVAQVPVLITEHGMSADDDRLRADFIEPALVGLLDVMDEGVPVLGYLHWTLTDNFEWIFGYGHQLGLHEVDRETFERTPNPSAAVYASIANANGARSAPSTVTGR